MNELLNFKIRSNVILKNRLVLAPMTTYSGDIDLTLSDEEEVYYKARGKEFGMVITAACAISKQAQAFQNQISIMDERYLDSMTRLANAIKSGGAKAILQLHHGGRMNAPDLFEGQDIVSASAVKANRTYTKTPRALTTNEVYQVINDFKEAAILAIKAGFEGVELHGANTYLIQQFFSPHSNQRTDEFGGSLKKRLTFPMLLVQEVTALRDAFNKQSFIIGYRLSPEELENPGITLEDTKILVKELSLTAIDYIHLSQGSYKQSSIRDITDDTPIIATLKKANIGNKVLIGVGSVESLDQVKEAIELGFDLVAIGKAALADINVVNKILDNLPIKKTFDKSSLLPKPLLKRIEKWQGLSEMGYTINI